MSRQCHYLDVDEEVGDFRLDEVQTADEVAKLERVAEDEQEDGKADISVVMAWRRHPGPNGQPGRSEWTSAGYVWFCALV